MIVGNVILIFVLIALNGFFTSVEFAAVASRRARLDVLADPKSRATRLVHAWLDQPAIRNRLIAATQLGITAVSLLLGAVGENTFQLALEPYFKEVQMPGWLSFLQTIIPAVPLVISLVVVTSLHVVLGEQVPKVAVLRAPERFALKAAPIMAAFSSVFKWFVNLLDWATHRVLQSMGIPASDAHASVYTLEELREMVAGPEVAAAIQQPEREMLSAVIDFSELVVRQVAIPRTEIIAVEASAPLSEVLSTAIKNDVTKMPVYEGNLDQVIGIIHLRDLMGAVHEGKSDSATARSLAREALFVPETISVNDLLRELRDRHSHIAIVLDEFGGTAGLVTLEDLLEEIIGVVQGPFDASPPPIQPLADGSALVDGMTLIEEINAHFGLELSDPNYDTIAGYILGKLGRIAQVGDVVEDHEHNILLRVKSMDHLRIDQVELRHLNEKDKKDHSQGTNTQKD
jgi:putative hemolysin